MTKLEKIERYLMDLAMNSKRKQNIVYANLMNAAIYGRQFNMLHYGE